MNHLGRLAWNMTQVRIAVDAPNIQFNIPTVAVEFGNFVSCHCLLTLNVQHGRRHDKRLLLAARFVDHIPNFAEGEFIAGARHGIQVSVLLSIPNPEPDPTLDLLSQLLLQKHTVPMQVAR